MRTSEGAQRRTQLEWEATAVGLERLVQAARGLRAAARAGYGVGPSWAGAQLGANGAGEPAINILPEGRRSAIVPGSKMPGPLSLARSDENVLLRFVTLADASDTAALRFVQQHGALEFCPHGLPRLHPMSWLREPQRLGGSAYGQCTDWIRLQPVEWYRQEARELRAILDTSSAIHTGHPLRAKQWSGLPFPKPANPPPLADARLWLAQSVRWWLIKGDVRPTFEWPKAERPEVRLHGNGLWGVLAQQLCVVVAQVGALTLCNGCHEPFLAHRQRDPRRRAWCSKPECQRTARREATRDYRARRR